MSKNYTFAFNKEENEMFVLHGKKKSLKSFDLIFKKNRINKKVMKNNKKIAILHDHFLYSGGGERLVTLLAKGLDADLATSFFNGNSLDPKKLGFKNKFIKLTKPIFSQGLRHLKVLWIFLTKTKFLNEYDTVIFSGNCIEAAKNTPNAKKVYYCHTPPRYIYDKYKHHLDQKKIWKKPFFQMAVWVLKKFYENNLKRIDKIITNSKTVQERLKKYTGYDSIVVYPPVDTSDFLPGKSEGFFLSYARLTDIKRVHLIAKAFRKMPEENLMIIFNKSDPYLKEVKKAASGSKNIQFVEAKGSQIPKWVSRCRATIYIPKDEDFGMSPVESMSAGKPCIGVNEGGLRETIIHGKTGTLLKPNFDVNDICKAVKEFTEEKCESMKKDCIKRAKEFDVEIFIKGIKEVINGK